MKSTNGAAMITEGEQDQTHEQFCQAVRELVLPRVADARARERLRAAKLVYGAGNRGARGVTFYEAWQAGDQQQALMQICCDGEETANPWQLPGTTIHEAAHVVAGFGSGHGREWKAACALLGLVRAEAAGQHYGEGDFAPEVSGSTPDINGDWAVTVINENSFSIPVNVTVGGTGGDITYEGIELQTGDTLLLVDGMVEAVDVNGADAGSITSSSVANPSVITTPAPHHLVSGDSITISGHSGSTPSINSTYTVTVLTETTFTIPVNVTVGGTGGSWVLDGSFTGRWVWVRP